MHRSRKSRHNIVIIHEPSPFLTQNLEDHLQFIRRYAEKFKDLDDKTRSVLIQSIGEHNTDYYHGSYITSLQIINIQNDLGIPQEYLYKYLYAISHLLMNGNK